MATSLITMLNRLPIYNRPKEPAIGLVIGNPVLVETTNPNIPTIPIPPTYDHFGNLISISTGAPTSAPPPLISPRSALFGGAIAKQLPPLPPDADRQPMGQPFRSLAYNQHSPSPSPPLTRTVSRKPAPGGSAVYPPPVEAHPAYRSAPGGYSGTQNPWGNPQRNLVSTETHGPRQRVAPPIMPPSPPHHYENGRPGLVRHQSIDDWVQKREENGAKRFWGQPTIPEHSIPPRASSVEPPKLNLKLDFEPLEGPHPSEASSKLSIPKDTPSNHISKPYTTPTDDILRSLSQSISSLRVKEPTPPPEQTGPKDHITELEERREKLTARRTAIRKEIWTLEQALDPTGTNPYSQTRLKRSEIKEMIEEKNLEVVEIDKEIHDVGMLIHRAWKRRCKNGGEGSTHLWVHNVVAKTSSS